MTRFLFRAYDHRGQIEKGELEASSRGEALETLARRGRFPVEVTPSEKPQGKAGVGSYFSIGGPLPLSDLHVLSRELASLAKARLPIDEALRLVSMQPGLGRAGRRTAASTLDRVLAGSSLGDALAEADGAVPEYFWRLVRAGEASGTVPRVLDELASSIEASVRNKAQIISAMIYPAFLLAASTCTLLVIILVMLPTMIPLFRDSGAELPAIIAILSGLQYVLMTYWPAVIVILGGAAIGIRRLFRQAEAREAMDRLLTRLPVISGLVMRHNTARFARTLAMLMRNGVSTLEALRICEQVLDNRGYRASLETAATAINQGGSLTESLRTSGLYPQLALRLLFVGERSGQMVDMLGRVAELYEQDLQQRVQRLLAMVSPIATLVIGGIVGLLVVSVMSAVLSLNQLALQ